MSRKTINQQHKVTTKDEFWISVLGGLKSLYGKDDSQPFSLAPGTKSILSISILAECWLEGIADDYDVSFVEEIIEALVYLALNGSKQNEKTVSEDERIEKLKKVTHYQMRLKAIRKILFPDQYNLPIKEIETFAQRYDLSPHFARAYELRKLMGRLSWIVSPVNNSSELTPISRIVLSNLGTTANERNLRKQAEIHWKSRTTLQSLAIKIYLAQLDLLGIEGQSERSLLRDLNKLREHEKENSNHTGWIVIAGGSHLPFVEYRESWRQSTKGKSRRIER